MMAVLTNATLASSFRESSNWESSPWLSHCLLSYIDLKTSRLILFIQVTQGKEGDGIISE